LNLKSSNIWILADQADDTHR